MERGQNVDINRNLKEVLTLMSNLEGFRTSVEKVSAEIVDLARQLELELEPEDMTKLLQPQDENLMDEVPLLIDEQRKLFLKWNLLLVKCALKAVEIKTKNLEYYINLINKAVAGFEIDSILKAGLLWVNYYQKLKHTIENGFIKGRVNWCMLTYFKKLSQPPQTSVTTTPINLQQSTWGQTSPATTKLKLAEGLANH